MAGPKEFRNVLIRLWDDTLLRRFWDKVDLGTSSECWEWTASRKFDGYGRFKLDGEVVYAHIISWCIANKEYFTPKGVIRHVVCDNPPCCNPDHLELGSHKDNAQDRTRKGRYRVPRQIFCSKGHTDIYWNRGVPHCRVCRRAL